MVRWRLAQHAAPDRAALAGLTAQCAETIGSPVLDGAKPLVAAGHQAQLWHPGILAKDIAVRAAAGRLAAEPLHVVVDHDVIDDMTIELPVRRGRVLSVHRLVLAEGRRLVAACSQPPADPSDIVRRIEAAVSDLGNTLVADVDPLIDAFKGLTRCRHLAEQVTAALVHLKRPHVTPAAVVFSSDLCCLPAFIEMRGRILSDARRCVNCYNHAVAQYPEAGVAPLRVEASRVELPLWALASGSPRRRVFADLSARAPALVPEDGRPIDANGTILTPRALLFTAMMRAAWCDLFVHGRGGATYDLITEQWFGDWLGTDLAPMTMVSADLHMQFAVPVAAPDDLVYARWQMHYLPHNLDRVLQLDDPESQRKRMLLTGMDDDRDAARRARAFREIHRINDALVRCHADVVAAARQQLEVTAAGVSNRDIAAKRDWCFAIYPPDSLSALPDALESAS